MNSSAGRGGGPAAAACLRWSGADPHFILSHTSASSLCSSSQKRLLLCNLYFWHTLYLILWRGTDSLIKPARLCWWTLVLWADRQLRVGPLCCGRVRLLCKVWHTFYSVIHFVWCDTLCMVWHTLFGVAQFNRECGGIGDWRKWLKFTLLHWQLAAWGARATRSASYKP